MRTATEELRLRNLQNYLEKLLGSKKKAKKLMRAAEEGSPILIDGPQGPTGKTTLCQALRDAGVTAYERSAMYEVKLEKEIPAPVRTTLSLFPTQKVAKTDSDERAHLIREYER